MNPRLIIATMLLVLGLAAGLGFMIWRGTGPASPPAAPTATHTPPSTRTCVYESPGGPALTARFDSEGVWLFLPEGTVQLPPVPAASGARYSDGAITLHTKGEEAILSRAGLPDRHLTNNSRQAVWEKAKLDGMDFRAVGNEPGWILELWPDRVVYRGDYGNDVASFPRPQHTTDQHSTNQHTTDQHSTDQHTRTTTFHCRSQQGRVLDITLLGQPCQDTMDGQEFETTVLLDLDGRALHGCGRSLH